MIPHTPPCSHVGCTHSVEDADLWRVFAAYETVVDDSPHAHPHPMLRRYPHAQGSYCWEHLIEHLRADPDESFFVVPVTP